MSLTPNDTFRCHSRTCTICIVFLLLRELIGRALRRILVAMAELSFVDLPGLLDAPIANFQAFTCALSFPIEGRPSKAQSLASHSLKRRSR